MFNLCPLKDKKVYVVQGHLKSHQSDEAVQDFRKKCIIYTEQVEQTKADDTIVHVGTCPQQGVSTSWSKMAKKILRWKVKSHHIGKGKSKYKGGQLGNTRRKQYVTCIQNWSTKATDNRDIETQNSSKRCKVDPCNYQQRNWISKAGMAVHTHHLST